MTVLSCVVPDPTSDPRTPGAPLSGAEIASWLYQDAALERMQVARLALLAASRPDLAPLCELLAEESYRRGATATMLAAALPRITSAPAAPPPPPGWWGRVRLAWRILFPGR